ncbi:MAG: exo-alpha-sialidase, partial [Kiritimatiellales bacterium]
QGIIYVNGEPETKRYLASTIDSSSAWVSVGGVDNAGSVSQPLFGAIDDVRIFDRALTADQVAEIAAAPLPEAGTVLPEITDLPVASKGEIGLWYTPIPKMEELKPINDVTFHAIKAYEPDVDGFEFLHGVDLIWHNEKLYASFGNNQGSENSQGEMARYRVSEDGGVTWGPVGVLSGSEGNLSTSHGVFLSYNNRLWAFQGAFYNRFERTHTRVYLLNDSSGAWEPKGTVVDKGFWPMQNPERMPDGNWIMPGLRARHGFASEDLDYPDENLPAVAISHGDDFTKWDLVVIPAAEGVTHMWGEAGVIVDGSRVTLLSRWRGERPYALIAESQDCGRTWTTLRASNMPMAASKPCVGMLSTGQRYLIANISANTGNRRTPLSIAYSRPGESSLSEIRVIRHSLQNDAPWSAESATFGYPAAVEHGGKLYVGYSNSGSAQGKGYNVNNAELAVIPIAELQ